MLSLMRQVDGCWKVRGQSQSIPTNRKLSERAGILFPLYQSRSMIPKQVYV